MNVREIFVAAQNQPNVAERSAFLDEACGNEADLRAEVEALLREHDQLGSFLESHASIPAATVDQSPITEGPSTVIGPYKLLEQIGEGGFGVVFVAEQQEPVRRKVALKLIKPGMDTRQVIARFEAERQALAIMDHPNIAKVFDAGTTGGEPGSVSTGRPYFVMELVHGISITGYCDQNRLTPRDRLDLFVTVCHAVQHAHQKGIIHRDIKPSNVLVSSHDGRAVAKVIDFGVAKAVNQQLTERAVHTQFAQMIGTPLYMSPEQAEMRGLDIDTRSDIYSLGVLLYELLTGTTPFDQTRFAKAAFDEIRRVIREEEPDKPSSRLSHSGDSLPSVAAQRKMEPAKLSRLVRGDLDWITMKALEKDRTRRYETANGFAMDVQRYLADEPVLACPPSAGYRLRKFVRRNKAGLAVAVLILFFLVLLGGGIGWVVRDRTARQGALTQEITRALEEAEDWNQRDNLPEAFAAVKRAESLLISNGGSNELQSRVHKWRGDLDFVARLEEIRLERARQDPQDAAWLAIDETYRTAFRQYGLDLDALDPVEAAGTIRTAAIRDRLVAGLDDWALMRPKDAFGKVIALARQADPDPWRDQLRDAYLRWDVPTLRRLAHDQELINQSPLTIRLLAIMLLQIGEPASAADLLRQTQRRRPADFVINFDLAYALDKEPSQLPDATGFYRVALALRPESSVVHFELGTVLLEQGKLHEAITEFQSAIALKPDDAKSLVNLGRCYRSLRQFDQAIAAYRKSIALKAKNPNAYNNLGNALGGVGKLDESIDAFRTAIAQSPGFAQAHSNLGYTFEQQGKWDEAIAKYREAIHLNPDYANAHNNLGRALAIRGKPAEAIDAFGKYIALRPQDANIHNDLAWLWATCPDAGIRDPARAVEHARRAVELTPRNGKFWNSLGVAHYRAGNWYWTIAALNRSLELRGDNVCEWLFMAMAHWRLGEKDSARNFYECAIKVMEKEKIKDEELQRFRAEAEDLLTEKDG